MISAMTRCILYRVLWALRLYLSTIYVELEQVIWRDLDVKHPVSPQIETYTILPFLLEKHNRTKVFLKPQLDYTKNTSQDIYFLNSVEIKTDSILLMRLLTNL